MKRIICLAIVLMLALVPLVACGEADEGGSAGLANGTGGDNGAGNNGPAEEVNPRERYNPNFEPVDMGGYVFRMATRDDDAPWHHADIRTHTRDLWSETLTGDPINDVIFRRNTYLEQKYNMTFEMDAFLEAAGEDQANRIVERGAASGDYTYDLLMTHMMMGVATATRGALQDIADFPNIDLSKPYWCDGATRGASVGGRLFTGLSDLSFSTNENVYCIFFNKDLMRDLDITDNPYELVRTGEWTFENFERLIRQGYRDLNGTGVVDEYDQFGYVSSSAMGFLWSGGSHIMTKDENDIPVLDFLTPRTLAIYDAVFRMTNNPYTWAVAQWHFEPSIGIFREGRGVFYSSQLCRVNDLRATEFDFGIVPYPQFDSAQENFYSFVDGHASMMAIPLHLPNPEWTGIIIEEMSFLAFRDVLPVYKDVVLNVQLVRDECSVEMLDILFNSKVFDPAYMMGAAFWIMWIDSIYQQRTEFVSTYERGAPAAMRNVERIIEQLLAIE